MSEIRLPIFPKEGYFGKCTYEPAGTDGPRVQRGIQLFHLIAGEVTLQVEDRTQILKPGDFALLLPNRYEYFQYDKTQQSTHTWCQLDFESIPKGFNDCFAHLSVQRKADKHLENLMEAGLSLQKQPNCSSLAMIHLANTVLYYYAALDNMSESDRTIIPQRITAVKHYIEENLNKQLTLEELAEFAHYSVPHFIHLFKLYVSTTPANYIRQLRLSRAELLLKETFEPIACIAEKCGFTSPFNFSRSFKEQYQMSPKNYRNQVNEISHRAISL